MGQLISIADLKIHFEHDRQLIPITKVEPYIGKKPLHNNWTKRAYTRKEIRQYSKKGFNLGWLLGPNDLVIDIDKKSDGLNSIDVLLDSIGLDIDDLTLNFPTVKTGGGGLHIYTKYDGPKIKETYKDFPGVEFKTQGRQVIIPGSLHHEQQQLYKWAKLSPYTEQPDSIPPELQEWLLNRRQSKGNPSYPSDTKQASNVALGALGSIPVEEFRGNEDWFGLMASFHYVTDGKGLDQFLKWSLSDPMYQDQESVIRLRWKSLTTDRPDPITSNLFFNTLNEYDPKSYTKLKQDEAKAEFEPVKTKHSGKSKKELLEVIKKFHKKTPTKIIESILKQIILFSALDAAEVIEMIKAHTGRTLSALREALKNIKKDSENQHKKEADDIDLEDGAQQTVTLLLENKFNNGAHLINSKDQLFWHYDQTHWKRLEGNILSQQVLETCNELKHENPDLNFQTSALIRQTEHILKAAVASKQDLFRVETGPQSIINTNTCEVHVDPYTGEWNPLPHRPESFLTACLNTEYDPKGTCPLFDQTLLDIFEPEFPYDDLMIDHIWELFGYLAQPRKDLPIWILFQGIGANGKSVLLQVLSAMLGESALEKSINELDPVKYTHAFQDLPGKLAIIDEDVKSQTLLPDDVLKKLSENKTLTANPKYSPMFKFRSTATIILASNSWPQTRDLSDGIKRRAMVIPFKRQFAPEEMDTNRATKIIETELPGILNKKLEGYKRLRQRGRFNPPPSCLQAADRWTVESNPFNLFIKENFKVDPSSKIKLDKIWSMYQMYRVENALGKALSKTGLRRALSQSGFEVIAGSTIYVKGLRR